jgi:hypothetical protein
MQSSYRIGTSDHLLTVTQDIKTPFSGWPGLRSARPIVNRSLAGLRICSTDRQPIIGRAADLLGQSSADLPRPFAISAERFNVIGSKKSLIKSQIRRTIPRG